MKRLKNLLTTGLGMILLGFSLLFVWMGKATLAEASGFMVMAITLMLSKDKPFIDNFNPKP